MLYHTDGVAKLDRLKVNAAVLVHGFDIALDQSEAFAVAQSNARAMTQLMGVPLSIVRTNFASVGSSVDARLRRRAGGLPSPVRGDVRHSCHGHRRGLRAFRAALGLQSDHQPISIQRGDDRRLGRWRLYENREGRGHCSQRESFGALTRVLARSANRIELRNLREVRANKVELLSCWRRRPEMLGRPPSSRQVLGLRVQNRTQLSYLTDILEKSEKSGMRPALARAIRWSIWLNFTRLARGLDCRRFVAQLRRLTGR